MIIFMQTNHKLNLLTFDIEEWFHINDSTWVPVSKWLQLDARVTKNTRILLDLLSKHKVKATFFVMGWIAEVYPNLVKQIAAEGHEIGYHSYYHMRPMYQSKEVFTKDLKDGISMIENITQKKIAVYRAPNLSLDSKTTWILPILIENGIKASSSTKSYRSIKGQIIPNQPFIWQTETGELPEFPLNRLNIPAFPLTFTGSGYFRLFPFWFTNYLYNSQHYNNGYFHPNDIDAHVPTPKELGIIRNWLNTVGSSTTLEKLDKLLTNHQFCRIGEAVSQILDSQNATTLKRIIV